MKPLALVIENDGGTRRLLDVLLTRLGLEVDLVATGNDALLLLEHVDYDLVLVDLMLPGRSGREVLEWIDGNRRHLLSRCVVLSSAAPVQLDRIVETWPAVRVIRKPFELGEMTEVAQRALETPLHAPVTVAGNFTRRSVRAGAKSGVVTQREGSLLVPVMTFGYTAAQLESFMPLHVDAPFPICNAVQQARPVWIPSVAMSAEYATLLPIWERNESRAIAAVPMLRASEAATGGIGWSFREPRLFNEVEQRAFLSIAEETTQALPS